MVDSERGTLREIDPERAETTFAVRGSELTNAQRIAIPATHLERDHRGTTPVHAAQQQTKRERAATPRILESGFFPFSLHDAPTMTTKALSLSPLGPVSLPLLRINKILSTSAGTDKAFMLFCYSSKIAVYALNRLSTKSALELSEKLTKLAAFTSDARVLFVPFLPLSFRSLRLTRAYRYRLFGLLPIISWLQSMNNPVAQAKKDSVLAKIEYGQALAMLCYYPLEHYCTPSFLSSPLPPSPHFPRYPFPAIS